MTPKRSAAELYADSMGLICQRLHLLKSLPSGVPDLTDAETLALQVRKIVEGIAFAALSGAEHRNREAMANLRTKDGADIIKFLGRRGLLHLPTAQDLNLSPDAAIET